MTDPGRPIDENTWRNRFILINLTRIAGTVIVLIGLIVWHSNVFVQGGDVATGLAMALIGLAISFGGPRYLARKWRTPPHQ